MHHYEEPAHLLGSSDRLIKNNVLVHGAETRTGGHFVYSGGISMYLSQNETVSRPTLR
jgi:hypothetical protein